MKDLAKFLIYLAAVIVLGALLAPPLYWGGKALAAQGIFPLLAGYKFAKFFDRAALVAAILLLWPTIRWLKIQGRRGDADGDAHRAPLQIHPGSGDAHRAPLQLALGLEPDVRWRRHWVAGFLIAGGIVALMALAYVKFGVYRMLPKPAWGKLPVIALSALTVGFLEEALFRGAIFGLLRRTMKPYVALCCVTTLFAVVHFLKPDENFDPGPIGWLSGFSLVPHVFHQFAEPMTFLAGFTTLFALGWLCGDAALQTRSLWMSCGLHTGVVFVKMGFAALSKRRVTHLPWIGPELQIGLVPVGLLLLGWVIVRLYLSRETPAAHPARP